MIKIRLFQINDLEGILKINQSSFIEPWPKNEFKKYATETFVAEKKGGIIGFIVGKTTPKDALIKLVAVDKNHQRLGIGRKLIECLLEFFKKNGLKTVFAHVRLSNENGLAFLKKIDFKVVKTVKNYYTNGENAYLIKKEL